MFLLKIQFNKKIVWKQSGVPTKFVEDFTFKLSADPLKLLSVFYCI